MTQMWKVYLHVEVENSLIFQLFIIFFFENTHIKISNAHIL